MFLSFALQPLCAPSHIVLKFILMAYQDRSGETTQTQAAQSARTDLRHNERGQTTQRARSLYCCASGKSYIILNVSDHKYKDELRWHTRTPAASGEVSSFYKGGCKVISEICNDVPNIALKTRAGGGFTASVIQHPKVINCTQIDSQEEFR